MSPSGMSSKNEAAETLETGKAVLGLMTHTLSARTP